MQIRRCNTLFLSRLQLCVSSLTPLLLALLTPNQCFADLVLTLSGGSSPTEVNFVASGSVTVGPVAGPVGPIGGAAAPIGGIWETDFDNNIGDVFQSGFTTGNGNLSLSSGITYTENSTTITVFDFIALNPGAAALGDNVQLRPDPMSVTYPELTGSSNTLAWSGSGTFNLDTGTYTSIFVPGSYSNAIDGGNYVVNVTAAVPEPSTFLFLTLAGLFGGGYAMRKRFFRSQDQAAE